MMASEKEKEKPTFFDFLGMRCGESPDPSTVAAEWEKGRENKGSERGCAGAGYGLVLRCSDLAPGRKRSRGSAYKGIINSDQILPVVSNSLESPRPVKILRKDLVMEQSERSHDDKETALSMQPPRPTSLIPHPPNGVRTDSLIPRWERSIITNPRQIVNYPSCLTRSSNHMESASPYVCRDATTGSSVSSKAVADEGYRTRIKECESLKLANPDLGVGCGRNSIMASPCTHRPKAPMEIEPGLSRPSCQKISSVGRQMTIFYDGQAHVFDDVHPNKADVILSLAGSKGGSWSTTYSPAPGVSSQVAYAKVVGQATDIRNDFGFSIQGSSGGHAIPAVQPSIQGKKDA